MLRLIEGAIISGPAMQLGDVTGWTVLAATIAIPLCYYFWKRWDRPSRAAKREQDRRLEEREVRRIFHEEEAKMREEERGQALVALEERKKRDAKSPSTEALTMALSSIDGEQMPEREVTAAEKAARSAAEIAELESIPESVAVPEIEPDESIPDLVEETGPIALKVSISLPDEVKPPVSAVDDEFEWPEWE